MILFKGFQLHVALAMVPLACLFPAECTAQEEQQNQPSSRRWVASMDWNGDLRLRYDGTAEAGEKDRSRFRYRGRLEFATELSDRIRFSARLATSNGNPVSTNLDFGEGFSSENIALDRAFINWTALNNLDIAFGKMGRPWFRAGGNALLWDSDFNPEGVNAKWSSRYFFANLGTFVVDERSGDEDSWLHAMQVGLDRRLSEKSRLLISAAYFDYTNTIGNPPFHRNRAKGNSVDADGNFIYDYEILEVSTEYSTVFANWPVSLYGVWAKNTAVDIQDTAFAVGVTFGPVGATGKTQFSYAWYETEADAVMGIFTDSDFGGGNTDSKGHLIKARYELTESVVLNGTFIISRIEMFRNNRHDYNRIQLDVDFLFD